MKPETLEALLLDRSLGELEPATAELLDAYLAQNPDAASRAAGLHATAQLARTALRSGPAVNAVRPLPAAPPWRRGSSRVVRIASSQWLKLAACLAVGAAAGWLFRPERGSVVVVAPPPQEMAVAAWKPEDVSDAEASVAWSARILARAEAASAASVDKSPGRYRLRWESPARKPQIEEVP